MKKVFRDRPMNLIDEEVGYMFTPWVCDKCAYIQQPQDNKPNKKNEFAMHGSTVLCGSCLEKDKAS